MGAMVRFRRVECDRTKICIFVRSLAGGIQGTKVKSRGMIYSATAVSRRKMTDAWNKAMVRKRKEVDESEM